MADLGRVNVLLVAPSAPGQPELLHVDAEVQAVVASLHALPLTGEVTRASLLNVVIHHWHIVWWAGHGTQAGLMLADGLLSLDDAMQMLRQAQPNLLVLNTCESVLLGLTLHHELRCPVICTIGPQSDLVAYTTGRLLAHHLANGVDVHLAFLRSRPGELVAAQNYRLFDDGMENRGSDTSDEIRTIKMLNEWGRRIEQRIAGLEQDVNARLDTVGERIKQIEDAMTLMQQPSRLRKWSFTVAWVFLFMPVIGFFAQFREYVGMSWQVGYGWAAVAWLTSALFFAYGLGIVQEFVDRLTRIDGLMRLFALLLMAILLAGCSMLR